MTDQGFDATWLDFLYSTHALVEVLAHANTNVISSTASRQEKEYGIGGADGGDGAVVVATERSTNR